MYKIRPAARLITSIGEGLIKDVPAAIVELVKNSYDADATFVELIFSSIKTKTEDEKLLIVVKDDGHGMSFDTVVNKWMVPATNDKLKRKTSLLTKRVMQGRKGIGRYASAVLGNDLTLTTKDLLGNKSIVKINWKEFEEKQYLTDINILINRVKTTKVPIILQEFINENKYFEDSFSIEEILKDIEDEELLKDILMNTSSGTELEIIGNNEKLVQWTDKRIEEMIKDLKKLLSPLKKNEDDKERFKIKLNFQDFPSTKYNNSEMEIDPYPLIELYDYRIHGRVDKAGYATLYYENNTGKVIKEHIKKFKIFLKEDEKYCGPIDIDLRVFDKDPESIDNLIQKSSGLINNETGNYLGKLEVKKLIQEISGVGIYRGDFRIRPYGDKGYDWLELDKKRVQNPSQRIGNDQIVGFVKIESEELSRLEEKSARDGLKETVYFEGLIRIVNGVITELEHRRLSFRKMTGKGRKQTPIHEQIETLFSFNDLTNKLENKLQELKVEDDKISEFKAIIKKSEEEKSHLLEEIQEKIAIYQGQATLGKIIMVLQHEGTRPIGYIKNQVPVIESWSKQLQNSYSEILLEKVVDRLQNIKKQMDVLSNLFKKIDPLSVRRRGIRKEFYVDTVIEEITKLFEAEFKKHDISLKVSSDPSYKILGWKVDLAVALTNIIENSIYWLTNSETENKEIIINLFKDEETSLIIDVIDNGPGIDESHIVENMIFEPDFTTKSEGTGLGLAIAGEAISRNDGKLKALNNSLGAQIRIEFKEKNNG